MADREVAEPGSLPATLFAPAKVTLSLRIIGVRADGLHLIDAEMVTVDLADRIRLEEGEGLTFDGPFAGEMEAVPAEANLVARALDAAGRQARVVVDKQIPSAAGLGGGSADAGAVLRWAGIDATSVAVALGADVRFCAVGGRARVTGVGEDVVSLDHDPRTLTLVTPPVVASTAEVYAAWDSLGGPHDDSGNDLEPAALRVLPDLARWRDRIGAATGTRPILAGSGATWWLDGDHAAALAGPATDGARLVRACRAVPAGWEPG